MLKKLISLCLVLSLLIAGAVPALAVAPPIYYFAHSADELIYWSQTADTEFPEVWGSWWPFLGVVRESDQIPVVQPTSEGYSLQEILVPIGEDNVQYIFQNGGDKFLVYIELPGAEDDPKPSLDEKMAEINRELSLEYEQVQYAIASVSLNGTETPVYYCNGGAYLNKETNEPEQFAPTAYFEWMDYTVMLQGVGNLYGALWDEAYFDLFRFEAVTLSEYRWNNPFADVTEEDWFHNSVRYSFERGLMKGVADDRFAPQEDVSRAMAITVLYRMAGSPSIADWPPMQVFFDLEQGWYHDAAIWGAGYGIIKGYGDSSGHKLFGPNDPVTREQLVTMFWRAEGSPKASLDVLAGFSDADQISPWAEEAFAWAVRTGLIQGKPGNLLDPQGTTSRAQLAQILLNSKAE